MKRVALTVGLLLVPLLAQLLMAQSPPAPPRHSTKTNAISDPYRGITASETNNSGQVAACCTSNDQPSNGKTETELATASKQQVLADYGRLPLSFEINRGQTDDQVKFLSRRPGFSLFLTPSEAVLALSKPLDEGNPKPLPGAQPVVRRKVLTNALRIKLVGANPAPTIDGLEELETKSNYFIGNAPKKWQTNVRNYAKVKYTSVYPGVDLAYYGNEGKLEHDFIVSPGADASAITLGFDKREKLRFDERGDVVVKGKIGEVHLEKPGLYQEVGGVRQQVSGGYIWKGKNQIGFRVGKYDVTKTLVIDPVLSYSTYASSALPSGGASASGIAVDSAGSAYVVGTTNSANFPTTSGAFQTNYLSGAVNSLFVIKLNATGSAVIYSTYLGDSIFNNGQPGPGIAVDSAGFAYVAGSTTSGSFPTTTGAFQTANRGASDVFVTKLNAAGSALIYSTLIGGNGYDLTTGITVDSAGSAYVTGQDGSSNSLALAFPTTAGAFQSSGGSGACFVTKLNATGTALIYSTFLGAGAFFTICNAITVDSAGSAYATGYSEGNFPTTAGAFQPARGPSAYSAFVTKLTTDGSGLVYSTFLTGNSNGDVPGGIAVDSVGSAYVTGLIGAAVSTFPASARFPTTPGAFQTTFSGSSSDVFAAKLTADGSGVIYSTYLGDSGMPGVFDIPLPSIAVDSSGSAIVTGATSKSTFPTTADAFQTTYPGLFQSAFLTKLNMDGSGLVYSTYLGGHGQAQGWGIAVDSAGSAYVTGPANSNDFPTTSGSAYPVYNSSTTSTGFVSKFDFSQPSVTLSPTSLTFPDTAAGQASAPQPVTFSVSGSGALAFSNITLTGTNPGDFAITSNGCGGTALAANTANSSCQEQVAFAPTATGPRSAVVQFTDDASGSPRSVSLSGTGLSQSTTTTLTSSLNPVVFDQSVTFTTTISPVGLAGKAAMTGTVMFYDAGTSLGSGSLSGTQATFSTNSLAVGTHSITAMYSGDANYNSSTSLALSQIVSQASTTTTLAAAPDPSSFGQAVMLTATVTVAPLAGGSPTGTATFFDGPSTLGTAALNGAATATFTTSSLAPGSHNLTASYNGDTNFIGSNTVSALTLTVQAPPNLIMENVTVADTVSFQDAMDSETVSTKDAFTIAPLIALAGPSVYYSTGSLGFGTVAPGQSVTQFLTVFNIGQASLTLSSAATSTGSAFTIGTITCTNGATSLPASLPSGGSCLFPITYLAPAGTPASDVLTFTDNSVLSNLVSTPTGSSYTQSVVLNGSGTSTPPPPPPSASVSTADNESVHVSDQVSLQVLNTTITSIVVGGTTFGSATTATVSVSSSTATVTGNVTLSIDGGTVTAMALSNGSATFSLGTLALGNHTLVASFAAQGAFLASSVQTVFAITSTTPTIASISPNSGAQGTVVNMMITGTNLAGATAVNVSGGGITVSNFVAVNATTTTVTFTIAPNAALSARNVTVTTPAGRTNAATFTVVAPPTPTLTSIAPAFELRGTSQSVILTGTNLVNGATVVATPAVMGFSISNVIVVSPTEITATLTSTLSAPLGNVNVDVVTAGGASNTLPFAITGPVLSSITPVSADRRTTGLQLALAGSGLTGATSVNFSGGGIMVTGITVNSDTSIAATVNISPNAAAGARNVTVTAPGGNSNAVTFTVTVPPVGLFSISPSTGARGTAQAVTLTGISFQTGANPATGIAMTGGGVTVTGFTVVNDTTITANFVIAPTSALTARNVTVTTAGGPTTPVTFTVVNPGTPILVSITPASGLRRTAAAANPVAVVLAGSNFTAGSTVNVVAPANGLTVTGVTMVSPTQINATFNTTTTAVIGPRSISVTTPGGTSDPVTYTVLGPVLTSITPTYSLRGQGAAVPVMLFGTGLTGTTAVSSSGGGITVGPITVVSDTQVNTAFTIGSGASGTARNVSVTAPGGLSNTVAFTVVIPPTPTLTSISPATGVRGTTTLLVTLTGANFLAGETTVAVSGNGVTVGGVTVTSSTSLTANLAITAAATLGVHNVTVTIAGAAAAGNSVPFTVQGATLTSINPNAATRPATGTLSVPVTIAGANLTGATGLTGLGGGVTLAAGTFTVVNSTTITATLNVSSTATPGIRNVGVTTPIGATNTLPFTVN